MKYLLLCLILSGCCTVPVVLPFPEVPEDMLKPCPALLQETSTLPSNVATTIVKNYTSYHECSIKQTSWIRWYDNQKSLHDFIKEGKK